MRVRKHGDYPVIKVVNGYAIQCTKECIVPEQCFVYIDGAFRHFGNVQEAEIFLTNKEAK